ncbi:Histone acetyltransferase KAT6A [Folsomia candida]|uniref:Histone acetyltransferase KAT6A n=1 Tax=Folsomia candida TaxID=158441 RepID=A0A226E2Q1_FOLCA|nr:Histone acetyltransferase KAT6A [Folsomia candida]
MIPKEKAGSDQWDAWLLEAVRKIRAQKQRPDANRIYNAVRFLAEKCAQNSSSSTSQSVKFEPIHMVLVQRNLDRAVRERLLLKVISKGQTTYKPPDKCTDRVMNLGISSDEEISKCFIKVLRELSEPDPTIRQQPYSSPLLKKPPSGFTLDQIIDYLTQSHVLILPPGEQDDSPADFLHEKLSVLLEKEILCRGRVEVIDGIYYKIKEKQDPGLRRNPQQSAVKVTLTDNQQQVLLESEDTVKRIVDESVSGLLQKAAKDGSTVTFTLTCTMSNTTSNSAPNPTSSIPNIHIDIKETRKRNRSLSPVSGSESGSSSSSSSSSSSNRNLCMTRRKIKAPNIRLTPPPPKLVSNENSPVFGVKSFSRAPLSDSESSCSSKLSLKSQKSKTNMGQKIPVPGLTSPNPNKTINDTNRSAQTCAKRRSLSPVSGSESSSSSLSSTWSKSSKGIGCESGTEKVKVPNVRLTPRVGSGENSALKSQHVKIPNAGWSITDIASAIVQKRNITPSNLSREKKNLNRKRKKKVKAKIQKKDQICPEIEELGKEIEVDLDVASCCSSSSSSCKVGLINF